MNSDSSVLHDLRTGDSPTRPLRAGDQPSRVDPGDGLSRRDLRVRTIHARIAVTSQLEPHHRSAARELVLSSYAALAGNDLPPAELAADLFPAQEPEAVHELCVAARTKDVILATGTLSFPMHDSEVTEALRLFRCESSWDEVLDVPAGSVGELGRFATAPILQRGENRDLSATIVREAVTLMLDYAREHGVGRVVAVMPPATMRMTAHAGLRFHPISEARLATDNARFLQMFRKYPRYWLPECERLRPKLYWFEYPA